VPFRFASSLLLILIALAPRSSAQVAFLAEGEAAFYVGGGAFWVGSAQKAGVGAEVGAALGWFDLGLAHLRFPPSDGWSPDGALAFSVGMTPSRYPEALLDFGSFVVYQETSLSRSPARHGTRGAEVEVRSMSVGVAASLPVVVRERGRVVPSARLFHVSQLTRPITSDGGMHQAFAWTLALGVREDLPGPFSLLVEPSLGKGEGTGLARGVTVRLLSVRQVDPPTRRTPP